MTKLQKTLLMRSKRMNQVPDLCDGRLFKDIVFKVCCNAAIVCKAHEFAMVEGSIGSRLSLRFSNFNGSGLAAIGLLWIMGRASAQGWRPARPAASTEGDCCL